MIAALVEKLCWWVVKTFPGRYRIIGVDGVAYLGRFYLKHNGRLPGIYLHHFYKSDGDRDLHNHPWAWSCSLILTGGYYEERFAEDHLSRSVCQDENCPMAGHCPLRPRVVTLDRKAPCINRLSGDTYHRVILKDLKRGAWTIFISGPEVKSWGFKTRETGIYADHKDYLGLEKPFVDKAPNKVEQ